MALAWNLEPKQIEAWNWNVKPRFVNFEPEAKILDVGIWIMELRSLTLCNAYGWQLI